MPCNAMQTEGQTFSHLANSVFFLVPSLQGVGYKNGTGHWVLGTGHADWAPGYTGY